MTICHNKSLAISFVTDTLRYRMSVANPSDGCSATPFYLYFSNIAHFCLTVNRDHLKVSAFSSVVCSIY